MKRTLVQLYVLAAMVVAFHGPTVLGQTPSVTSLTVVDANTGSDLMPLEEGAILDLAVLGTRNLNVRVDTDPPVVGSVQIGLDGNPQFRVENSPPYALAGDLSGSYLSWTPSLGQHTVSATPYTSVAASGMAGNPLTIGFFVQDSTSIPAPKAVLSLSGPQRKWEALSLSVTGPESDQSATTPNPFLDYRLQVRFTGPRGQIYDVPGYFDGDGEGGRSGNVWRARFAPDQAGEWTGRVSFRTGPAVAVSDVATDGTPLELDGASLTFAVGDQDPSAPGFLKWGRLEYVGLPYLKFRDGGYFIKTGTDEPENLLAYAGFDNTIPSHFFSSHVQDWRTGDPDWGGGKGKGLIGLLNYFASREVNSLYALLMNIGGDGKDVWPFAGNINRSGSASDDTLHYDLAKLRQWEVVFGHAERKGVLLHLLFNENETANKRELDNGNLGAERKLFYREMIARFAHHNAIQWNISEEWNSFDGTGLFSAPQVKQFAAFIKKTDPYQHPVAVHNYFDPFFGDPGLDVASVQYYPDLLLEAGGIQGALVPYGAFVEQMQRRALAAGKPIVIGMDEPDYVTEVDDDTMGLAWPFPSGHSRFRKKVLWPTLLSGAAGVEIISTGQWHVEDFRPFEPVWHYLKCARAFMEENLPFSEMETHDELLAGEASDQPGPVVAGEAGQVFAKLGTIYAVYLPKASPSGLLNLTGLSGGFQQRWYNPRTGLFEGMPLSVKAGGWLPLGSPPDAASQDWVVLLDQFTPENRGMILVNGSFEEDYQGWTATGNQRIFSDTVRFTPSEGVKTAVFNAGQKKPNGSLSQNLATTAGQVYVLTFDLGAFSLVNQNPQRIQVTVMGNSTLLSETLTVFASGDGTTYAPQSLSFVADTSTAELTFTDVSPTTANVDLLLDNVRVAEQSPPSNQ